MFEVTSLCGQIYLGKQGENLARLVCFDELKQWKTIFGEGECELFHQRNGDNAPYPVVLEIEDDKICWKITDVDTAIAGEGKCELHYSVDGVIVKSKIWVTSVLPSLGEGLAEPPEPQKAWVDQVLTAAQKVEDATTHQPMIGENKNWFIWDVETNAYIDSGVLAEGQKGEPGVIKFVPVVELPETGDESVIYLLPNTNTQEQNIYDEYIYTNGAWEKIGSASVEVDLTDYVKNTDYATNTNAGVIKADPNYAVNCGNGILTSLVRTIDSYNTMPSTAFISKGTLDNVLDAKLGDIETLLGGI